MRPPSNPVGGRIVERKQSHSANAALGIVDFVYHAMRTKPKCTTIQTARVTIGYSVII